MNPTPTPTSPTPTLPALGAAVSFDIPEPRTALAQKGYRRALRGTVLWCDPRGALIDQVVEYAYHPRAPLSGRDLPNPRQPRYVPWAFLLTPAY